MATLTREELAQAVYEDIANADTGLWQDAAEIILAERPELDGAEDLDTEVSKVLAQAFLRAHQIAMDVAS